ncbi:MAG: DUF1249 domain-containing protein [Oleiphilaceae bacterium]|nr:DUF1249 domain-containing protein [Oleiphilaceae bacterium]
MRRKYVPDLVKLGAHYEANYRRMMQLLRLMTGKSRASFVLHAGERFVGKVELVLLESCKYTDTLLLEQTSAAGKWLNNPKMTVRLYHDATVAEVISCHGHRRIEATNQYPNKYMHHPDEKSQLNAFLSEWLGFCLSHGCCDTRPFDQMKL